MKSIVKLGLATLLATTAYSANAQEVQMRLSHWVPATHPVHVMGLADWTQSIHEASEGRIEITIYPGQQLGAAPDHYDMARDGIADITYTNPGYQAGRFPIYGLAEIPFHGNNAVDGAAALHEWYEPIAETEMSDVYFCLINPHDPGTIHARVPIRVPADIEGKNIRPAHATMARFVSSLGGNAYQVPAPEARDAISRGIADAITFPWNSILLFGIDAAVSYHLDMPFYATTFAWVMNPTTYDNLSDNQKQVIDDHCTTEWAERVASGWADYEDAGRIKLLEMEGHEGIVPTDEEVAAWREAAEPLRVRWAQGVSGAGHDPDEVMSGLMSELEARDSAY